MDIKAGYYIIAFMDLLGIKNRYGRLENLFSVNDDEKKSILRYSIGPLLRFRDIFDKYYASYEKKHQYEEILKTKGIKVPKPTIRFFSDSILLALPLVEEKNQPIISELLPMLDACATACLMCAYSGYPIRGGIELGVGVKIDNNEITGKVLSDAVILESKKAIYPRVIFGDKIINFIKLAKSLNPASEQIDIKINKMISDHTDDFISKDYDEFYILDYLNNKATGRLANSPNVYNPLMHKMIDNIELNISEMKDEKILHKYEYLKRYVISKIGNKRYSEMRFKR